MGVEGLEWIYLGGMVGFVDDKRNAPEDREAKSSREGVLTWRSLRCDPT